MTKVAVDARRLQDRPYTGVGRLLANTLPCLPDDIEVVLLTDDRRPSPEIGDYEEIRLAVPRRMPEPIWLQVSAAHWLRRFAGVFHGTYYAVPYAYRGNAVVSLYDLSWEHHSEDFTLPRRLSFRSQARWSARHANAVVTCSEHARASLVTTYRLDPERVLVAPPSVDAIFSPTRVGDLPPILDRLGIDVPYVVALGGARRRGLEVAVAAWQGLPAGAARPTLVVVGAEAPPPGEGIVHAGRLSDHEWSAVLAGATAFCYPTRFEGYGMPALEAAASGTPVVCARIGPLPDVLGDAAVWCDTPTAADIGRGLAQVVADEGCRVALRAAGLARAAAAPTWQQSALVQAEAYRMAEQ